MLNTNEALGVARTSLRRIAETASDSSLKIYAEETLANINALAKERSNSHINLADELEARAIWESKQSSGACSATIDLIHEAVAKLRKSAGAE